MSDYKALKNELESAFLQAASGKGKERHSHGEAFEKQQICQLARWLRDNPVAGPLFQACKKILETSRLDAGAALRELDGAINYIAAAKIVLREGL